MIAVDDWQSRAPPREGCSRMVRLSEDARIIANGSGQETLEEETRVKNPWMSDEVTLGRQRSLCNAGGTWATEEWFETAAAFNIWQQIRRGDQGNRQK